MLLLASSFSGLFKWRQFEPEVILLAVGWYLRLFLVCSRRAKFASVYAGFWLDYKVATLPYFHQ
jgi:hypothetical protein